MFVIFLAALGGNIKIFCGASGIQTKEINIEQSRERAKVNRKFNFALENRDSSDVSNRNNKINLSIIDLKIVVVGW